ncbi:MAG: hypothetical protein O7E54_12770, partial [Planctomycetota bacterium]|nr:hypothetical protein [Planctomycetota bacterium]
MPKTNGSTSTSGDWDTLLRLIPGYDPFETAGDCVFDEEVALHVLGFIEDCMTHVMGQLAGEKLLLERWQKAIVANLFGWKRLNGTRRYR